MKLYLDQDQDQKSWGIVCKDERDWINTETGKPYREYNMCDINLITSKNKPNLQDSVFVINDMGVKLMRI